MDWGACVQKGAATLDCLPALFQNAKFTMLIFAGIIAVIFVIISGMKFLFSGGDAKQVEEARKTLTYALLGLIVVVLAFLIINLIATITGAGCILNFGFTSCNPGS